jgi:hypothetical protein
MSFPTSKFFIAAALVLATAACTVANDNNTGSSEAQWNENNTGPTDPSADPPEPQPTNSHVGVHGMVLFGTGGDHLYLSHIPLYDNPHNIQVIVEVEITAGVLPAQQLFATKNFTFRPSAAFSLHNLAHGFLNQVGGTIYMGNFESGGTPAFRNVKFAVKKVIFERDMKSTTPRNLSLDYIAVGSPAQPFLVHLIDAPPSFDHVAQVTLPANSFLDAAALEKGTMVRIANRTNTIATRLKTNTTIEASLVPVTPPATDGGLPDSGSSGSSTSSSSSGGTSSSSSSSGSTSGGTSGGTSSSGSTSSGGTSGSSGSTSSGGTSGGTSGSSGTADPDGGTDGGSATVSYEITVKGESSCLPGPDFFGNCPAAQ